MKCYACCRSRLRVTHTYDDGEVALRRRSCAGCGLRVVTEERPSTPLAAPVPRETLWILHHLSRQRVWIGFDWPTPAEGVATTELKHLGRFVAVGAALEARFRVHFAAARLEGSWYDEQVAASLRRLLKVDPRGRLGSPVGGPP